MNKTIIIVVIVVVIGVALLASLLGVTLPSTASCEDLYNDIENVIANANYCHIDSDCDVLLLGGEYVAFGCYHFINKDVDKEKIYAKMGVYRERCSQIIDMCAPAPEAKCSSGKCVYIEGRLYN